MPDDALSGIIHAPNLCLSLLTIKPPCGNSTGAGGKYRSQNSLIRTQWPTKLSSASITIPKVLTPLDFRQVLNSAGLRISLALFPTIISAGLSSFSGGQLM